MDAPLSTLRASHSVSLGSSVESGQLGELTLVSAFRTQSVLSYCVASLGHARSYVAHR